MTKQFVERCWMNNIKKADSENGFKDYWARLCRTIQTSVIKKTSDLWIVQASTWTHNGWYSVVTKHNRQLSESRFCTELYIIIKCEGGKKKSIFTLTWTVAAGIVGVWRLWLVMSSLIMEHNPNIFFPCHIYSAQKHGSGLL